MPLRSREISGFRHEPGHPTFSHHRGRYDVHLALASIYTLSKVNFFETDVPSSPAWTQENGVFVPVIVEKLMQHMLEWDVAAPNCLCPLQDPSSALVQMNLRRGEDG